MKPTPRHAALLLAGIALTLVHHAQGQDWPQWRGPDRSGKAAGFKAPKTWPKELSQKWKVAVGDGVASPALVGDRLYVFSRQDGNEVIRCLDAGSGKELWADTYEALGAEGPASSFSGPRCSPAVAEGKVVTVGVRGMVSCLDAASGKVLWRKNDFAGALPRFFTSSSPLIVSGLAVVEVGGPGNGGIVAYQLANGEPKWKWTGDGPGYASPMLMTLGGGRYVVAQTDTKVVALDLADGKLAWETPFAVQGRGYNAITPIVDGATVIYGGSGRGLKAVKLEKSGDGLTAKELWANPDASPQFATPVLKGGHVYGLNQANDLFCLDAANGQTAWTAPASPAGAATEPGRGGPGGGGGPGGRGGGRGGGMRGGGYGSFVDAGDVVLALTPASELLAIAPEGKAYREVARIKVAESPTHAYPVLSGNRVFVKDRDSLALLSVE